MRSLTAYMLALGAFPARWASPFSDEIRLDEVSDLMPPNPPSGLSIEPIPGALTLTWQNPTHNADSSVCTDLRNFRVYRATVSGIDIHNPATYESVINISGETYTYEAAATYGAGRFYRCVVSGAGLTPATSLPDRGYRLRAMQPFFFVVTAVDSTGNESAASAEVTGTPQPQAAAPPQHLSVRVLPWNANHATGVRVGGDYRVGQNMVILEVGAFADTAGVGGLLTVDINRGGVSILSTKITLDSTEKTSRTAATQPVLADVSVLADEILTFDIDATQTTVGQGLTVWFRVNMGG